MKVQLYKTLIRPVIMYGQSVGHSQSDEQNVDLFERKVLRRIYDPIQDGDIWRSRCFELYIFYRKSKLTVDIRTARL
jgi:hypothetical protein